MACNDNMDKHFDVTLYGRINEKLELKFNCTVPFLPAIKSKLTGKYIDICKEPNTSVEAYKEYDYLKASGQNTLCDSPCAGMDIYLGLPFIATTNDKWAYIKIYLKSTVKLKYAVLDYTPLSLVAEVGGLVGLILGISIVHIALTINSFFMKHLTQKLF